MFQSSSAKANEKVRFVLLFLDSKTGKTELRVSLLVNKQGRASHHAGSGVQCDQKRPNRRHFVLVLVCFAEVIEVAPDLMASRWPSSLSS